MPKRKHNEAFSEHDINLKTDISYRNKLISILIQGDDIDEETDNGYSLLYNAVIKRDIPFIRNLLDAGADPNFDEINGKTPLYLAFDIGELEIAELLLEYIDEGYNKDPVAFTLLTAVIDNNINLVRNLVNRVNFNIILETDDDEYFHPLLLALQKNYDLMAEVLIEHGSKLEECFISLLMDYDFSWTEALPIIKKLVKKGVDINEVVSNEYGKSTVLTIATFHARYEVLKYLAIHYRNKINIHQIVDGSTYLYDTIANLYDHRLKYSRGDTTQSTEFWKDFDNTIKLLISLGARFDIIDQKDNMDVNQLINFVCTNLNDMTIRDKIDKWVKNRELLLTRFYNEADKSNDIKGFNSLFSNLSNKKNEFFREFSHAQILSDVDINCISEFKL